MKRLWKLALGISIAIVWSAAFGQETKATVLEIDVVNAVNYENDTSDYSKLATGSAPTVGVASNNFFSFTGTGDIVAVNGKPAKGVFILRNTALNLRPAPAPGQAIADVARAKISQAVWEILQTDGTPVASIMGEGLGNSSLRRERRPLSARATTPLSEGPARSSASSRLASSEVGKRLCRNCGV